MLRTFTLTLVFLCIANVLSAQKTDIMALGKAYIDQYKDFAISEMQRTGIPASIKLGQGILESDYGRSALATNANNHFGAKCHNTWNGPGYRHDDDAPQECFRVYESVLHSYQDHAIVLSKQRYAFLFDLNPFDYVAWSKGLKKAGYATNPKYAEILISIIERFELYNMDFYAMIPQEDIEPTPEPIVRRESNHHNTQYASSKMAKQPKVTSTPSTTNSIVYEASGKSNTQSSGTWFDRQAQTTTYSNKATTNHNSKTTQAATQSAKSPISAPYTKSKGTSTAPITKSYTDYGKQIQTNTNQAPTQKQVIKETPPPSYKTNTKPAPTQTPAVSKKVTSKPPAKEAPNSDYVQFQELDENYQSAKKHKRHSKKSSDASRFISNINEKDKAPSNTYATKSNSIKESSRHASSKSKYLRPKNWTLNNGVKCVKYDEEVSPRQIAMTYGFTAKEILEFNDMANGDSFDPYENIYLEYKRKKGVKGLEVHLAEEGQNIRDISQQYGIQLHELCKFNRITPATPLRGGMYVYLRRKITKDEFKVRRKQYALKREIKTKR